VADAGFTALTSARLVLRRFREADLDAFVAYRSDRPGQARQLLAGLQATHPDTPGEWFQFALAAERQGRGHATEAVRRLLDYLLVERARHRREGHLLESTWSKGEWTSDLLYAVPRRDWPPADERPHRLT
jgi:aminoglycoside 6'-N-acetyltransferase